MDAQLIARWQFGITTIYHFFFVPITIALSMLVAVMQTIWVKTSNDRYLKLTKFYGNLFLINFALGVVTGIVQEFQFGMNWSEYSRFVGDIFGAPLALEALIAFFLESTFIGLWIFGWDRLPKKIHLATIYLTAFGTMISAVFILAANSWMQNPVGASYNPQTRRAELTDFGAVLTNPVLKATLLHQLSACYVVAGAIIAATAFWHLSKVANGRRTTAITDAGEVEDARTWRWATKFGAWVLIAAGAVTMISADYQGKVMTDVQPMKMASAEGAYYKTSDFSLLTIGKLDGSQEIFAIKIPGLLGFLGNGKWGSTIEGINNLKNVDLNEYTYRRKDGTQTSLQSSYAEVLRGHIAKNGIKLQPNIPVTYWSFRIMITLGMIAMAAGLVMLIWLARDRNPRHMRWLTLVLVLVPLCPLFANSFGWLFTEMGRQPWIVAGVLPTTEAVSPGVSAASVFTSVAVYTLIYGALAVVEVGLFFKAIRKGLPDVTPATTDKDEDAPLSFAY
ncbi:cytochrome ubiquinol oxidase subunit I [Acidipropionibacterium jensenii]|uniref:Cytochrome ubiquinol oxidase subunit I n=1 Tax=Acidipropionibacterium jensenii TaxID=1749 RepID=A0A3Q9ULN9_9ACTN|nr:cytochrome ubiquinol oxidase subunit I [Acidipropionibacterium jensenii]AZZ40299.1 cytochrome ubiquinol oxidase subunit I [Acidipropionibacterium jensenii]